MSQAGTVQISYVLTIYFISQEQNNGGFVHNSLSEKKCTVGKHKNSPAYHKPGSHKGKSPYALIPNGNNMMKPYHTLSGRHGMHFSPVSSHMKKDRKDVFSPVSVGSPDKSGGKFFNSIENLHLCTMNNQGLLALAQLILPSEILSNFEVVRVEEEASLIRIYLDESVKAEYKENPEIESKGFCEAVTIRDFPIRDKGVDLIVRRRKWYDKQNNRYFSDSYDLKAEETRYSKEFAAFLKGVYGDDSYDLPFA